MSIWTTDAMKAKARTRKEWDWKNQPELREKMLENKAGSYLIWAWAVGFFLLAAMTDAIRALSARSAILEVKPEPLIWAISVCLAAGAVYGVMGLLVRFAAEKYRKQLRALRAAAGVA